jgi:5-methylcytosine-specific restriction endonuclease McrA
MRAIALERGYGKWMKGKKHSPEAIEKMRRVQAEIGNAPEERQRRAEQAKNLGYGKWMAGRAALPQTRAALAQQAGQDYDERYGDRAEEERRKRREGNRARWEGVGRKPQREKHNHDYRYREWRTAVFRRDDYTCRNCGTRGGVLNAHHMLKWSTHPEHRYIVANGRTLCETCHRRHPDYPRK